MTIWEVFMLVGGLAVFLYGMLLMNDSLTAFAGEKLQGIMLRLTKDKFRGYLTGFGVTVVNQSSSATTVLEAVLVGAGLITFQQSLAVTLGAELGSTVLGQLVAIPKLSKFSTLIIAIGFFGSFLAKTKRNKHLTRIILGFGLLFLGMDMMSTSLENLRSYQPFLDLMVSVQNPLLGILIGLGFTMIVQSSGATSGIVIAMGLSGTITLAQAVPINLGASIGTCITAILGSLALNREAKRTAYIHVLFQTIGVIFVYTLLSIPFNGDRLWLVVTRATAAGLFRTDDIARQIAMAHTMMPVLNHIIVFPMLPLIVKFFNRAFPSLPETQRFGPKHINDGLITQPEIALEQAGKETMRVAEIVEEMLQRSYRLFCCVDTETQREKEIDEIAALDENVDLLRNAIVEFLTKVAGMPLAEQQSHRIVSLLYTINELENLADVIDVNILDRARKLAELRIQLPEEGAAEISALHAMVFDHYKVILKAFMEDDKSTAEAFLANRGPFKELQAEIRTQHFKRLQKGHKASIEINPIYMDLLGHYNRINRHVIHIAKRMVE
ncbi:MAG: hypothetical protein A3J97_00450 [Spirochaetes bacterium RIFOXYC1_FULL_54_7]|nr:MAG: hypothetical protein A3J97_00450 [Spirochaetes bacterium RIFOXYC1_FULL_54_7]